MASVKLDNFTYRPAVKAIIINSNDSFLLIQKVNYLDNEWEFPGGGIEKGESPEDAILRELKEELGTDKFEIIEKSEIIHQYDWPAQVVERRLKEKGEKFKGQSATQFLVRFDGEDNEISIDESELKRFKWVKFDELKNHFHFPNQLEKAQKTIKSFRFEMFK